MSEQACFRRSSKLRGSFRHTVSSLFGRLVRDSEAHKKGRKMLLNVSSFQVLAMFRRGLFYSYLSIYLRDFLGLSVTETTFFATFPMLLNVLFQTSVWGVISDRFQLRRTLIVTGEFSAAVSTFFVWYLHTLPRSEHVAGYVIIVGLSAVEAFWSMSNVGWSALLSDLYPTQERAGLQGKLSSIGALGRIFGVWIGGLLYDGLSQSYEGWGFKSGWLFFVASGVMVFSTIPMLFVPEGGIKNKHLEELHVKEDRQTKLPRLFLVFLLAMIFINFGRNSVALTKSQYLSLDEGFNVSSSLLSYAVNMSSVGMFFVGLLIRRLSDRWKDEVLLLIGCIAVMLSLLAFALAENLPLIFASNFADGASQAMISASSYAYVSRMIPSERRGRQFALFNATFFLSWGIPGTLIAGPIVDHLVASGATWVFSYKMSFIAAAALVSAGTLVLLYAIKMDRGSSE